LTDLSASYNEMVVRFKSPAYSFLYMDYGMSLTLASRSHNVLLMVTSPTQQRVEKLPGFKSL